MVQFHCACVLGRLSDFHLTNMSQLATAVDLMLCRLFFILFGVPFLYFLVAVVCVFVQLVTYTVFLVLSAWKPRNLWNICCILARIATSLLSFFCNIGYVRTFVRLSAISTLTRIYLSLLVVLSDLPFTLPPCSDGVSHFLTPRNRPFLAPRSLSLKPLNCFCEIVMRVLRVHRHQRTGVELSRVVEVLGVVVFVRRPSCPEDGGSPLCGPH